MSGALRNVQIWFRVPKAIRRAYNLPESAQTVTITHFDSIRRNVDPLL